jgi:hypothetical protein
LARGRSGIQSSVLVKIFKVFSETGTDNEDADGMFVGVAVTNKYSPVNI